MVVALLFASGAWAQQRAFDVPDKDASETSLETIVVTAEKRETNLQKTPIAITAISGATLNAQGIHDATGLNQLVPNLQISTDQPDVQIVIRGVASLNNGPGNDPAVAFMVDGVYLSRSTAAGGSFFDLDHVEVLRGPQGTLYGRNADAGTISIVPKTPTASRGRSSGLKRPARVASSMSWLT